MGNSRLNWLTLSLAALSSFAPAPTNAQMFLRCSAAQQAQWLAAWNDAIYLATSAWAVLSNESNEALVRKYFFAVSTADRAMVQLAFQNAANSATIANAYVLSCGDFRAGDPSTGVSPTITLTTTTCSSNPLSNAFTVKYTNIPPATVGAATDNIAGCAVLNADRTGSLQDVMFGTPAVYQAFWAEKDFPIPPENVGTDRRTYFRGWTLLHELLHTTSVGGAAGIVAQGPGDLMPYPGAADFTYDQEEAGLLEGEQAARNADSYAHFAWEAFFQQACGRAAKAQPRTFNPDDFVDWDKMKAAGLMARSTVLKHNKSQYRPPQAVPRYAAPEPAGANPNVDSSSNTKLRKETRSSSKALVARAVTKLKTHRKTAGKGVGRVIKLQKCAGCRQVPKAGAKKVAPKGQIKKTALKKCKPREIYIPTVLLGTKVSPKAKKGMCVPLPPLKGATTKPAPGTVKPAPGTTKPGTKTPVVTAHSPQGPNAQDRAIRGLSMHEGRVQLVWMQRIEGSGYGFLRLSLLAIWAAGSLYNSPIFPYSPVLLPSSRNVLYILLIHTFLS